MAKQFDNIAALKPKFLYVKRNIKLLTVTLANCRIIVLEAYPFANKN
jgi:hypothetical protein